MWSQIVLFVLVGIAYASNNPAWNDSQEYVYQVRGRTLTGLYEVSNQYSGVLFRATLRIQPRGDSKLQMLITNSEYGQVHSVLSNGWNGDIPEEEMAWKPLQTCSKPFQADFQNGIISNVIVHEKCKISEINLIKSIVSLFQINTNGENTLPSPLNTLPDPESNSGVFLTKEDTILGVTETLYKIAPLPDYQLFNSKENARFVDFKLKQKLSGDIIEVTKHEEFSDDYELPAYVYGFCDYLAGNDPATNKMGNYYSRDSSSRVILLGNLNRFNILHTSSVNTILLSPTITDEQKGAVFSIMEAELQEMISQNEKIEEISQPVELDSLVFSYSEESLKQNKVQAKFNSRPSYGRIASSSYRSNNEDKTQPRIDQAPETPFLLFSTEMSTKSSLNLVQEIQKLAKKIGKDLEDQEKSHHEKTLDRYVKMVSLMRLLDADELKQLVKQFYHNGPEDQRDAVVSVIRDAVAEVGTGPAMLVIQDWIETEFITGENASEVISAMANSVRHPTEEYMKAFFELTQNPKVLAEWPLNDTALLSFTHLARKVYIDNNISDSEYPVNYFGSFRTEEGRRFIREEVIPYYSEMLDNAVEAAETHKIHAYIRATGNLADPRILNTFEPYLEGKKPCSQFQRLLMVLSIGKLAETYPEEALAVFFRIYQNPAEHPAVRIASVFQVMRSKPTMDILQIMAANTHMEANEHINAVVKSAIENLSELEGDDNAIIRESAKVARRQLSDETESGLNFGADYLRSYVIDELNTAYKTAYNVIPSEDEYLPKGLIYTLQASLNGIHRKLVNVQAIVSSVDQLVDFTYKQTKNYNEQQQLRQQSSDQQQHPWSSENIAKILNLKADEREQLEGYLYLELGAPHRMLGFDNITIEQIPQYIRQLEQLLKKGQEIRQFKLFIARELTLAVPTITGFQMIYTLDSPILIKAQGQVSAVAQPQVSSNDVIQAPEQLQIQSELRLTVSGKTQGRFAFIVPSLRQQYISGYDKHWELNVPKVESDINIDLEKQLITAEMELKEDNAMNVFHYRTWPYTARSDLTDFEPLSSQKNTRAIEPRNMHGFKQAFGKNYIGVDFEVEINQEREFLNMNVLRRVISNNGILEGLRELWRDGYVQNSQFEIRYSPEESSVKKIKIQSSYDEKYFIKPKAQGSPFQLDEKMEQAERQKQIMEDVAAEIHNARVDAIDTVIQLEGDINIQYLLTGAYAKSNVDPTSRVRVCFKRTSENKEIKDWVAHFVSKSIIKNTNGLDLQYTLDLQPKVDTELDVTFGHTGESKSKMTGEVKHQRSEERKQFLMDSHLYKQCKQQMQEGNKQSYTCTNMTMKANLLDHMEVKLSFENVDPFLQKSVEMAYEAIRFSVLPNIDVRPVSGEKDAVSMEFRFHPDLKFVNVSLKTPEQASYLKNIAVIDVLREAFVVHPVFHLPCRLSSYYFGVDTYRDFCSIGETSINTFSNKTYEARLSEHWTVMAMYLPKEARESNQKRPDQSLEKQLKNQLENVVALVRQNKKNRDQKDIKIVVSSPSTDFEVFEIDLTPNYQRKVQVEVNGKKVQLNKQQSEDFKDGYIQVYALPNDEVKVEVYNRFYIIYDGHNVRLTALTAFAKDALRGLCGQFNDQQSEDFIISETCISRNPEKFVKSFEVEGDEGKQIREQLAQDNKQCAEKEIPLFVNVITDRNARRESSVSSGRKQSPQKDCLFHQTRYIQGNGQICFTTREMPACKSQCRPRSQIKKTIGVHCLQKTKVADLWKNQIDQEQSPDFSNKKQHKTVEMLVPESCSL